MLPASLTAPATEIGELLKARGQTVAVAEVSAGGLISAALISIPGASAFYAGGTVSYTIAGVVSVLGDATDADPGGRGACEPFARFLAQATAAKHGADWGIGETGASGPDGNPYGDPAGHGWVASRGPDGAVTAEHVLTGEDDRSTNMELFAALALTHLAQALRAA